MKHDSLKPLVVGLLSIALVGGAYIFGYSVGHENLTFDKGYVPKIVNTNFGKPKDVEFDLFWEVWDKVRAKYAGKIDNKKMVYDAINGALRSLDDPYTLFMPPDEAKRFNEDLSGHFDGIGAEIESRDGAITVVAPLEDSPAEKAGLRPQDVILKIDNTETTNMTVNDAVDKIRGTKGTAVKLTLYREGATGPIDVSITRDNIVVKSVKVEMKEGNIGYIKVSQFGADTKELMNKALDELLVKKPKGVIIDVRNNPGGFLDTAVDVTSLFLKERGAIVKDVDKAGKKTSYNATSTPKFTDTPLVVLANSGSASASEIFTGALQDYGRAKFIGVKTFGKGSVQQLEPVSGSGAVRITIAEWLTPKDRHINKHGLEPDIEVKMTEDDFKNKRDPQLDRAMQELNK